MPSKPAYDWPIHLRFQARKKPHKGRLPGLYFGPMARFPDGTRIWFFGMEGLLAN